MSDGKRSGSGTVLDAGLVEDIDQVVDYGALADYQRLGDLAVALALSDESQHFGLACTKPCR